MLANIVGLYSGNFAVAFEKSYYLSNDYISNSSEIIQNLSTVNKYKSEDYILSGSTLTKDEIAREEDDLYDVFTLNSSSFNPNLTRDENYKIFREVYADKISQAKGQLINNDLYEYNRALRNLEKYQGLIYYYTKNGEAQFTNSTNKDIEYFKSFPAYILINGLKPDVFPQDVNENSHFYWLTSNTYDPGRQEIMYIAFTDEFLKPRIEQWNKDKLITNDLYWTMGYLTGLIITFIYLIVVIGRKPEQDEGVQLNFIDRIYNDFKIGLCLILIYLVVCIHN